MVSSNLQPIQSVRSISDDGATLEGSLIADGVEHRALLLRVENRRVEHHSITGRWHYDRQYPVGSASVPYHRLQTLGWCSGVLEPISLPDREGEYVLFVSPPSKMTG